jgi:hypothetical protein
MRAATPLRNTGSGIRRNARTPQNVPTNTPAVADKTVGSPAGRRNGSPPGCRPGRRRSRRARRRSRPACRPHPLAEAQELGHPREQQQYREEDRQCGAIGAELVDVGQGTQFWGEHYTTRIGDITALEEDIAGEISRGLRLKLARQDETLPTARHTGYSKTYRLCLRSRYELVNARKEESFKRAVEYAQQAIESQGWWHRRGSWPPPWRKRPLLPIRAGGVATSSRAPSRCEGFRGPGINNWNLSLFKNFPIGSGRTRVQLRVEAYNVLNHTQFGGATVNSATGGQEIDNTLRYDAAGNQINANFGRATAARNARILQGSLRFSF